MYIVIVGAGEVGFHIATVMINEGHEVAIVDRDPSHFRRASEELDALVLLGNGASKKILREAHIARANILVAVTDADEVNIVACMAAKHVGVPLTIARIRNPDYLDEGRSLSAEFVGIDQIIQPEGVVADEIARLIDFPGALDVVSFAGDQAVMVEIDVSPQSTGVGRSLAEVGLPRNMLLTAILRGEDMTIPNGESVLRAHDRAFLVGKREGILEAMKILGSHTGRPRRAYLIGVGEMGLHIAVALEEKGIRLTILEKDEQRATLAATLLTRSLVLHEEGFNESMLLNEGVDQSDLFIATTGDDRLNILSCLQARLLGARRTIAVVERSELSNILEAAGVDIGISPRRVTASSVLRFIRAGEVHSVALVDKSAGEVLELGVSAESPIAGKRLKDVRFPPGALAGVIVSSDGVHVAHGSSVVNAGDSVIVFSLPGSVAAVEGLFSH